MKLCLRFIPEVNHKNNENLNICYLTENDFLILDDEKKINNDINFLRGQKKKIVSIFRLGSCWEVEVSLEPNEAVSEIYTQGKNLNVV